MYRKSIRRMSIFIHHGSSILNLSSSPDQTEEPHENVVSETIEQLIRQSNSPLELRAQNLPSLLEQVSEHFRCIEAAGGLLQDPAGRVLFIFRRGYWDLPKGKIDPGETPLQAAQREIEEETGVKGLALINELNPTYHIYELKGEWHLKKTHWFQFEADSNQPLLLQAEEDIEEAEWMTDDRAKKIREKIYPSLLTLLDSITA